MRINLFVTVFVALTMLITMPMGATPVHAQATNSESPQNRVSKERLIKVLADLRTASPNFNQFEPMLRVAVQQQKQRTDAYFAAMGTVKDVAFVGAQNGGDVFQVTFEHGVSAWWIQIAPNGNIAGLTFQ
jgi:hypothetical protein